jgi:hypothetical protein
LVVDLQRLNEVQEGLKLAILDKETAIAEECGAIVE